MKKEPKYIYTRDSLHSEIDFLPSRHLVKHTRLPSHRALTNRKKIVQYQLVFPRVCIEVLVFWKKKNIEQSSLGRRIIGVDSIFLKFPFLSYFCPSCISSSISWVVRVHKSFAAMENATFFAPTFGHVDDCCVWQFWLFFSELSMSYQNKKSVDLPVVNC